MKEIIIIVYAINLIASIILCYKKRDESTRKAYALSALGWFCAFLSELSPTNF